MKQKIKCRAVLFDLWNTLVCTFGITRHTQKIMGLDKKNFGCFIKRFEKATMLKPFDSVEDFFASAFHEFAAKSDKKTIRKLFLLWRKNIKKAKPFPETMRVLHELKKRGFKLGIVSNCQYFYMHALLKRLGFDKLFDSTQLSFETHVLKPNPKIYLRALKELGVKPSGAVMVGDSDTDINGAGNAKIRAILLDRRARKKKYYKAVAVINSLSELLELLEVDSNGNN